MRRILLAGGVILLSASLGHAQQCCTIIGNTVVGVSADTSYCPNNEGIAVSCNSAPDEGTLARWAADHAVSAQLGASWPDKKAIGKLDRAGIDALAARIDTLRKWAQKLSNHIIRDSYIRWAQNEESLVDVRRSTLDKLDVAKGLVTGLPALPGELAK